MRIESLPEQEALYVAHMGALVLVCQMLAQIDLDFLDNTIQHAHTTAPILDPTAYRDGLSHLRDQEKVIQAAKVFRDEVKEVVGT